VIESLGELRTFVRVVEAGGFTAAARELAVSTALVSKQVGALEGRLGVRLLDRNTRRCKPTEAGRAFHARCVAILQELQEAESAVQAQQSEIQGTLRVTLPPELARLHLAALLPALQRRHPRMHLRLTLSSQVADLVEEEQDMALRFMRRYDAALHGRPLGCTTLVMVASPRYLDEAPAVLHPDDLARHRGLVYGAPTPWTEFAWNDGGGRSGLMRLPEHFVASSTDMVCMAATLGMGIAMTTTMVAGEALRRGDLVRVLPGFDFGQMTLWAVYPHRQHMTARLRAWIDFLVEAFGSDPDIDPFWHGLRVPGGPTDD